MDPETEPAACGKVRYLSRRNARRAARQHRQSTPRLTAYQCVDCGLWHLTSQSAKRKTFFRAMDARTP